MSSPSQTSHLDGPLRDSYCHQRLNRSLPKLLRRWTAANSSKCETCYLITLHQHLDVITGSFPFAPTTGLTRPHLQEINSVTSWISCFLTYTAVKTTDMEMRNHLTYARLLIQEALCHGAGHRMVGLRQGVQEAGGQEAGGHQPVYAMVRFTTWTASSAILVNEHILAYFVHCARARTMRFSAVLCLMSCLTSINRRQHKCSHCRLTASTPVDWCQSVLNLSSGSVSLGIRGHVRTHGQCGFRHICATCHETHKATKIARGHHQVRV